MCTVSFLPISLHEFILTSNRDEDVNRPSALPVEGYNITNSVVYFPKDQKANGTWIATSTNGYTLCLLNGAFEAHTSLPPYKKSRGIMLLDFFEYNDVTRFSKNYDFNGIEPFTLVIVNTCTETQKIILNEIRWNGNTITKTLLDSALPHIWSSATLYTIDTIKKRECWFNEWVNKQTLYTQDAILFFHRFAGDGSLYNDLMINRGEKKTVSITSIHKKTAYSEIVYEDLLQQKIDKQKVINC